MVEYLLWLNEHQGVDYTIKVKFANASRDISIQEGKVALADILGLCSRLSSTGWVMGFDEHLGKVTKLEIDSQRGLAVITADLDA